MPDLNRAAVDVWKMRFRRKYTGAGGVATLATLADTWAADAAESVTFTETSMEGGTARGVVTGNRLELLAAAEELLSDPQFLAGVSVPAPRILIPDFRTARPV